jgi:sec-independent protein translocase protein TatA
MLPGPSELLLILIIVIVVFGAKRIPEIMGGIGKGIRTFKKAMDEDETPPAPAPQAPESVAQTPQPTPSAVTPPPQAAPVSGETTKEKTEAK